MTPNPQFAPFLDAALALALHDDTDECVQEANEFIDEADMDNGFGGALVEAWYERWQPYQQDRLEMAALAMTTRLEELLKKP